MRGPFLVILLLLPNFCISQKIHCWFGSGTECIIGPKYITFNDGSVFPIESMRIHENNSDDITDYEFITRSFRYWFCRYNGVLYLVVSPKNPIWLGLHDKRNKTLVITKFTIRK